MSHTDDSLLLDAPWNRARRADDHKADASQAVRALDQAIARVPTLNRDKVARLKAAVTDGSYRIDAERIAACMDGFEAQLGD